MIIVPPHLLVTVETHGTYLLHNGHDTHHVWHTLLLRVWRCIGQNHNPTVTIIAESLVLAHRDVDIYDDPLPSSSIAPSGSV